MNEEEKYYPKQYPVAEIFDAPQGEGMWAGVMMTFVRLAGCNVGKPYTQSAQEALGLQVYQERCTDYTGSSFPCDTNYRMSQKMTIPEILRQVHCEHVCITGGEPFLHDLWPLVTALDEGQDLQVHIETSGTIAIPQSMPAWICISPKQGYLKSNLMCDTVDEIKLLVGPNTTEEHITPFLELVKDANVYVFVQPINDEKTINQQNVQRCLALMQKHPQLRLSIQLHKIIGSR